MSQSTTEAGTWSPARRLAFRFVFAYLVLFILPFPLGQIPGTEALAKPYARLWEAIVPWVGKHVLRLSQDIAVVQNGSGDRTYDYVQTFCNLTLAAAAALVWSLLSRRRAEYTKLQAGLRVYVRYTLGTILIGYGFAKVFKTQFPFPRPSWLLETYGESSPMRLLWAFMGYSTGYNIFTGGAEVLGGLLLFFRRTTTLGALICVAVMSNVMMLNFCYDVPVKLFSTHLVLMAVFLLGPDLRRLASVLVLNRPTQPAPARTPFEARWLERARLPLKTLFLGSVLVTGILAELEVRNGRGDGAPKPAIAGAYEVEEFVKGGATLPPLATETVRWKTVSISIFAKTNAAVGLRLMNDEQGGFRAENDAEKSTLVVTGASGEKSALTYSLPDPDHLILTGSYQNDTITVRLRRIDESKFLLVNRGFHWINEAPYNR